MTGGLTVPSVSGGPHLPLSENGRYDSYDPFPDFCVEWVPTPPETTIFPIYVDLSIVTEPGKTISLLIFQNNQELQFAEVTRVLGEKDVPLQRQQHYIEYMSSLFLGLRTTDSGYFRVTIKCDLARSTYLNLVRSDEEVGSSSSDQMRLDNSFDHNRVTRPRLIDLNVEPDNEDLLIPLDTTSWNYEATEALPEIDDYYHIEDFLPVNYRDFEATTLQFHDQAPQYQHISSVDHDTEDDLHFVLVDFLEMEFADSGHMEIDDDGNEDISMTILLESIDTHVATTIPASQSAINELEKVRIESMEAAKHAVLCAICMEDFEVGVEATRLPCLHLYHGGCVVPWLETNHQCPLCRFPMPHW